MILGSGHLNLNPELPQSACLGSVDSHATPRPTQVTGPTDRWAGRNGVAGALLHHGRSHSGSVQHDGRPAWRSPRLPLPDRTQSCNRPV